MTHLLLQSPAGDAGQLILLVGPASSQSAAGDAAGPLWGLGLALAAEYPTAWVVGLPAGAADDDDAALLTAVRAWQRRTGVAATATLLVGHGDGAARAIAAVLSVDGLAGRVVAIGPTPADAAPEAAPRLTTLHLVHGKSDARAPYGATVALAEHLVALGADLTADILPFVDHGIGADVAALVVERLRGYLPRRTWDEAMRTVPADAGPGATARRRAGGRDDH